MWYISHINYTFTMLAARSLVSNKYLKKLCNIKLFFSSSILWHSSYFGNRTFWVKQTKVTIFILFMLRLTDRQTDVCKTIKWLPVPECVHACSCTCRARHDFRITAQLALIHESVLVSPRTCRHTRVQLVYINSIQRST